MKDAFGNILEVGDLVVHAKRSGSSCWLGRIRVTEVSGLFIAGHELAEDIPPWRAERGPRTHKYKTPHLLVKIHGPDAG